jgi:hypothetical protein
MSFSYQSQRGLAAACKTTSETIARIAGQLNVGTRGMFPNSPKTFTVDEASKVMTRFHDESIGQLRNKSLELEDRLLRNAEHMSRLASLAHAHSSPAAAELAELAVVVGKIRAAAGPKADLVSAAGKTKFLNAMNPHSSSLMAALAAVNAELNTL